MTSVDETVAHDLAALATDSRRDRRSAEDALRAALARARREANPVPIDRQLAVVHAARVFTARVARAAAGAAAMLCAVAVLAVLAAFHAPGLERAPGTPPPWWVWPVDGNAAAIAMLIATLASGAYVAAGSLAGRWIEERWRRAATGAAGLTAMPGPRMARLLDAAAVALPVAGATCALVVVGVLAWTAGRQRLWLDGAEVGAMFADRLRDLTIAVPSAIAAAGALGLACARRARWAGCLERRGTAWLGLALVLIAIRVAAVHHLGPLSGNAAPALAASSPLRTALTAAGALAAFLFAAGLALGQRRRELRFLEAVPGELQPADGELVALAGVLRSRVARAAAGGVAAMLAVGLTVMLHHPRQSLSSGFHVLQLGSRLPWLVGGQGTLLVVVAALVLGAMQLGPAIADRWLARRLARCPTAEGPDARLALARRLVRRLDAASLGLAVAGGAALVLVIAIVGLTIGDTDWAFFAHHGPRVDATLRHLRHEVVAAVAVSFTAGLALAEAAACAHRARRMACGLALLAHPAVIIAGALLGKLVSIAWMHLDLGVGYMSAAVDPSSRALQTGLTAALTGAVLVVASGLALRRRRREQERTNQASPEAPA